MGRAGVILPAARGLALLVRIETTTMDDTVLLQMSFNPFRTPMSLEPTHSRDDLDVVYPRNASKPAVASAPSSGPLSWFWSPSVQSSPGTAAEADYGVTQSMPQLPSLIGDLVSPASPAKNLAMNRGVSPVSREDHRDVLSIPSDKMETLQSNFAQIAENGERRRTSYRDSRNRDPLQESLPPYPERSNPPRETAIAPSKRSFTPLLQEFPKRKISKRPANTVGSYTSSRKRQIEAKNEATFPGFALHQRAIMYRALGDYSKALDITTECLAFQKRALEPNLCDGEPDGASIGDDEIATPLDLRSTYLAGVGSSVLDVVQSLRSSNAADEVHHVPTSAETMAAEYPAHPCVVETLLLRGRMMHACFKCGGDASLLSEAGRTVEMALALQRKIGVFEDLAAPLVLFGNLQTELKRFEEADLAYREALLIFSDMKDCVEQDGTLDDLDDNDSLDFLSEVIDCAVATLHLRGESLVCGGRYVEAFICWNKALRLAKSPKRRRTSTRRILAAMKHKRALDSIVNRYWEAAVV